MVSLKHNRAAQRKRNLLAKELRTNKIFKPKRVDDKKKRENINIREIDKYIDEDGLH